MGRPKLRYSNSGRVKTNFTLNFDDPDAVLEAILPLMENNRLKGKVIKVALGIIEKIDGKIEGGLDQATTLIASLTSSHNTADVKFLIEAFGSFVSNLPIEQQLTLYKMLGNANFLVFAHMSLEYKKDPR